MFAAIGVAMTALGVAGLLNLIRGGPGLAIFGLVTALVFFGIAAYFVWAYFWLRGRPEHLGKAGQEANIRKNLLKGPEG